MSRITSFALGVIIAAVFGLLLLVSSRTIVHGQNVAADNLTLETKPRVGPYVFDNARYTGLSIADTNSILASFDEVSSKLTLACGIAIDLKTGKVDLGSTKLDEGSKAFWKMVEVGFEGDARKAAAKYKALADEEYELLQEGKEIIVAQREELDEIHEIARKALGQTGDPIVDQKAAAIRERARRDIERKREESR